MNNLCDKLLLIHISSIKKAYVLLAIIFPFRYLDAIKNTFARSSYGRPAHYPPWVANP